MTSGDQHGQGTSPSGAVTVTVDPRFRVTGLLLAEHDDIRRPASLARAFDAAYALAVASRSEPDGGPAPAPGARPVAVATRPVFRRPTPEMLQRHRVREESPRRTTASHAGEVTGTSSNECVRVTLAPARPSGTVEADPGWLAHAARNQIVAAIIEAFEHAYAERDR